MIKSNDANGDGKLQPDEMEGMFFKPKDTNGDGAVTADELTAQLERPSNRSGGEQNNGEKPEERTARSERGRGDRSRDGESSGSGRKSYRFLSGKERSRDAPSWFLDADEDGDGQVLMAEYAERWTESKATEFARRDLDGDGVITPSEAASGRRSREE